jgi:CRP-like cAMP-binding protein
MIPFLSKESFTCHQLKKHEFLVEPHKIYRQLFYVVKGAFKIGFWDKDDEQIIRLGYPGQWMTALDSYISGNPTQLFIQSIKKAEVWSISYDQIQDKLTQAKELEAYQQLLHQLIFQQFEREVDILTKSPKDRFERVWKRSPQLFQEVPHKYIARYLRMTPETLSRLQKS